MSNLLRQTTHWFINHAARGYSAPTLGSARAICEALRDHGFGSTVCFWNADSDSVEEITLSCLQLLELLADLDSRSYLSLKLPAIHFNADAVAAILKKAARMPRMVHFDSHGPEDACRMFDVIEGALRLHRSLGCTIPGRWRRSLDDASRAVDWKLRIRVVKGQWPDPEYPDMDMREGFLKVIDQLRGKAASVAVASHDVPLARQALRRLLDAGTPCELELLYGLPRRAAIRMARDLKVPVRFYVPQGKAWLPYLLNHARKNPRVIGWFARDLILGLYRDLGTDTEFAVQNSVPVPRSPTASGQTELRQECRRED
jgi:proline dehydrogenase